MKYKLLVFILLHLSTNIFEFTYVQAIEEREPKITDYLYDHPSYSKDDYPHQIRPTEDRIGMYINQFSINERDMTFELKFYMRQAWKDERLKFDRSTRQDWDAPNSIKNFNDKISKIHVPPGDIEEKIFHPDLFFRNGIDHINSPDYSLMTINQTGHAWFVRRHSATFSCAMRFNKFPFDTQMCRIMFESFSATMDSLYFNWLDSPVDIDPVISLPAYTMTDIILYDCSQNYTAGAFPCLEVRFVLRRDYGYYLMLVFVPSALAVILSWSVFWTDMGCGFQVILEVLLILTIAILNAYANQLIPRVSYFKAIDVWCWACIIMVFAALATSISLDKTDNNRGEKKGNKRCGLFRRGTVARIVFPSIFVVFVIIYDILFLAI